MDTARRAIAGTLGVMVTSAPRIDSRLKRRARRLSRRPSSVADIHRSVGRYAARIGVTRPSYEQTRVLVNDARLRLLVLRAAGRLLLEVDMGMRPATDLLELLEE